MTEEDKKIKPASDYLKQTFSSCSDERLAQILRNTASTMNSIRAELVKRGFVLETLVEGYAAPAPSNHQWLSLSISKTVTSKVEI
jgi:hypothetical protein